MKKLKYWRFDQLGLPIIFSALMLFLNSVLSVSTSNY